MAKAGVLKQLSEEYRGLTINVTAEGGNARPNQPVLSVRNGAVVK